MTLLLFVAPFAVVRVVATLLKTLARSQSVR